MNTETVIAILGTFTIAMVVLSYCTITIHDAIARLTDAFITPKGKDWLLTKVRLWNSDTDHRSQEPAVIDKSHIIYAYPMPDHPEITYIGLISGEQLILDTPFETISTVLLGSSFTSIEKAVANKKQDDILNEAKNILRK